MISDNRVAIICSQILFILVHLSFQEIHEKLETPCLFKSMSNISRVYFCRYFLPIRKYLFIRSKRGTFIADLILLQGSGGHHRVLVFAKTTCSEVIIQSSEYLL